MCVCLCVPMLQQKHRENEMSKKNLKTETLIHEKKIDNGRLVQI